MEKETEFHRKGARLGIVALAMSLLAMPVWAQSPVTLAGGGVLVSFPPTQVGQSTTVTVTLSVIAPSTLVSFSATDDFALKNATCNLPLELAAGDSCVLGISFTPSAPGPRWSPLLITDSNGTKYAFGLVGSGIGPVLTFSPGIVSTVAGRGSSGYSGDGGPATSAQLNSPMGMVRDNQGNLYIADSANNVIRKINADGIISTAAGNGTAGYSGDGGPATQAQLAFPSAVAIDRAGSLYVADLLNFCIRKIDTNGIISTFVTPPSGSLIKGVTADAAGNVYYSSWIEGVWKVDSQGVTTRIAGNGNQGFSGDGGPATDAQTSGVAGLALDSRGNLYMAEILNSDIRKVDANGIITTVAGSQQFGYSGDGGPATNARLNGPTDVRIDAAGDLYIVDSSNNRIRKVNASGTINSIAGGDYGYAGDGGLASNAQFAGPVALTLDEDGNLLIADTGNSVIREVKVASTTLDFGTVTVGQTGGPLSVIVSNAGNADLNVNSVIASSNFAVQTTCPANTGLPAGADCSLDVSFTPIVSGNITGTVSLSDDAPGHPHIMNLKGQGYIGPVPSQLVFATQFSIPPLNGNLGMVPVNAMDANGSLATGFNGVVTLQLQGPAGFTSYRAQVNASGGTATFDLSAVTLDVVGSYAITASSSGLTSAQASFTVVGNPNFSISTSKQSMTIGGDSTGTVNITVTPTDGFSGAIALSCSGLPVHSTCSFAPASLNADGSGTPLLSVLTVSTGVATVATAQHPGDPVLLATGTGIFSTGLLGLVFARMGRGSRDSRNRRPRLIQLIVVGIILCAGLIGCGGLTGQARLTPPGSYTVTITAASIGVSHSHTVTLVVQ
jgi:sugar lactone lactonase YvrE